MQMTTLCAFCLLCLVCVLLSRSRDRAFAKADRVSKELQHYFAHLGDLQSREAALESLCEVLEQRVVNACNERDSVIGEVEFFKEAVAVSGGENMLMMLRQARDTLNSAPTLSRLKVQTSMNGVSLPPAVWKDYLDRMDAQIAIMPVIGGDSPYVVAIRHTDGWVQLHDGFYDLLLTDGKIRGTIEANMSPVARPATTSEFSRGARQMRV